MEGAGSRFSILSIVAILAFTISVALSIAVFIYQKSLVRKINTMNAELVAARASFEPGFIDELIKLDRRIKAAQEVLSKHAAVSSVFGLFENETIGGIRFVGMNYAVDAKGQIGVDMKGEAINFLAIASQSDIINADKKIISPVFSGLNLDDKGIAKFDLKAFLDGDAFLYQHVVENEATTTPEGEVEIIPSTPIGGSGHI